MSDWTRDEMMTVAAARQLFLASVIYLPLLTSLLMLDRR